MVRCVRVFAVAAVAVGLAVAWRQWDVHGVAGVLAGASVLPFLVAVALNLFGRTAVRARRTQLLLGGRVRFREVVRMNLAGYAAAAMLPGPAEEAVQCTQLARANGFTLRDLGKYQLADKGVGLISMAAMALPLLPPLLAIAIGAAGLAVLVAARPQLVAPLGYLMVSNMLVVAIIWLCVTAVGGHASARDCLELMFATSLATALPLVPGHVGTFEAGFVLAATHLGMPAPIAVSAAVLYHVAQIVPLAVVGAACLVRLPGRAR